MVIDPLKNEIEILNVAGPRASKDSQIYGLVTIILELAYNLGMTKDDSPKLLYDPLKIERPESTELPKTVDEAVKIAQSNAGLDVLTLSWLILRLM